MTVGASTASQKLGGRPHTPALGVLTRPSLRAIWGLRDAATIGGEDETSAGP